MIYWRNQCTFSKVMQIKKRKKEKKKKKEKEEKKKKSTLFIGNFPIPFLPPQKKFVRGYY